MFQLISQMLTTIQTNETNTHRLQTEERKNTFESYKQGVLKKTYTQGLKFK